MKSLRLYVIYNIIEGVKIMLSLSVFKKYVREMVRYGDDDNDND